MSFFYTSFYLTKNTLLRVNDKYKRYFNPDHTKLFLYANSYQIPELYRLIKKRQFSYDLYEKMTSYKQDMLIKNMVKEAVKNKYYPNNMLLLYSICISIIFFEELKKTDLKKEDYLEYDFNFALSKNENISHNHLYEKHKSCMLYSFTELDFLKASFSDTYLLPKLDTYISLSIKMFKRCLNPNPFFRLYAKLMDLTILKKKETKFSNFIYKKKYIKRNDLMITYNDQLITFETFLYMVSDKALLFLDAINDALFLDKLSTLVEYAKFYNWHSIVEYYDFVNKQKEDDEIRNKKINENKKENKKKTKIFNMFNKK